MIRGAGATTARVNEVTLCLLPEKELLFPGGLLGFPNYQRYKIERLVPDDGSESPFFLLSAVNQELSFPLVHPASLAMNYPFPVNDGLLAALGAKSREELLPLLIVTVRDRLEEITVNLQGPLVVNPISCLGLQLVVEDYPLRHPLINAVVP